MPTIRHPLNVALSSIFRVAQRDAALNSVQLAAARDMRKAKALAAQHSITIERDRDGHWVTHSTLTDSDNDPLEGNHFCVGGWEVLEAVQAYVDFLETTQPTTRSNDHA